MSEENNYGSKGYGCVAMAIAGVALLIAIIALRKWDTPLFGLSASDVTVADSLSLLVTILIGWQIWATIASREEIRRIKEKVDIAEQRFASLNHQLAEQHETIPHIIEAARLYSHAHTLRTVGNADATNLREAYALYLEAIVEFLQFNPADFVDRCMAGIDRCQDPQLGAFLYDSNHDLNFVNRCNRNYAIIEGLFNRLSQEQRERIKRLRETRLKYHISH